MSEPYRLGQVDKFEPAKVIKESVTNGTLSTSHNNLAGKFFGPEYFHPVQG